MYYEQNFFDGIHGNNSHVHLFQSCGDVDHSNPRSVADKAMEYYISNDYEGMSTLCYPENTNRIERFLELEEYAKKNPDIRPKSTNKKFKYTDEKDIATNIE